MMQVAADLDEVTSPHTQAIGVENMGYWIIISFGSVGDLPLGLCRGERVARVTMPCRNQH